MEATLEQNTRSSDDESRFGSEVESGIRPREVAEAESEESEEELVEEEMVELESGKAIPKLQMQTMHCPNCMSRITKVLLRRKIINWKPQDVTEQPHKSFDLLGCFSWFSFFLTSTGSTRDRNKNGEVENVIDATGEVTSEAVLGQIEEEIMEEEVVELEFEKAIPKLQTHTMHCLNCDHHITKVVLRQKIIRRRPPIVEQTEKPLDLLGCFSCLSLFTSTDNGRFNPFRIFGNKPISSADNGDFSPSPISEDTPSWYPDEFSIRKQMCVEDYGDFSSTSISGPDWDAGAKFNPFPFGEIDVHVVGVPRGDGNGDR